MTLPLLRESLSLSRWEVGLFFLLPEKHNYSSEAVAHLRKRRVNCKQQTENKQQTNAMGATAPAEESLL